VVALARASTPRGTQKKRLVDFIRKALRDQELLIAGQAERAYEHFVSQWQPRRPKAARTSAAKEERR
jgi:hypothetical protein